jgi:hypothetical protein
MFLKKIYLKDFKNILQKKKKQWPKGASVAHD